MRNDIIYEGRFIDDKSNPSLNPQKLMNIWLAQFCIQVTESLVRLSDVCEATIYPVTFNKCHQERKEPIEYQVGISSSSGQKKGHNTQIVIFPYNTIPQVVAVGRRLQREPGLLSLVLEVAQYRYNRFSALNQTS